jgi:uncharacterized protein YndB with AHSA1/START domain
VSVLVAAPLESTFRVFTEEIDQWWRRGLKYRVAGKRRGIVHLEPRLGGRLYESFESRTGTRIIETGTVLAWDPPSRLLLQWRSATFDATEKTEVEVSFEPSPSGTLVTVNHRGWSRIRGDHPVRHGNDAPAFIRMMGLWWADLMTSLREHLAGGDDGG